MIETNTFVRKPFQVEGVQVTAENMANVAEWCEGRIRNLHNGDNGEGHTVYIKVRVHRPLTDRQTMAFVGDWVLSAGKGFKVYTTKAFENSFEPVEPEQAEQLTFPRDNHDLNTVNDGV